MLSVGIRFHGQNSRVARDATVMALAIPFQEELVKVSAPPAALTSEFGSDSIILGTLINRMFHKRPFPKIDGLARVSLLWAYQMVGAHMIDLGSAAHLSLLGACRHAGRVLTVPTNAY